MERGRDGLDKNRVGGQPSQPTGFAQRQNPLDPTVSLFVETSLHHSTPQRGKTQGSLGAVVRGIDPFFEEEQPKMPISASR